MVTKFAAGRSPWPLSGCGPGGVGCHAARDLGGGGVLGGGVEVVDVDAAGAEVGHQRVLELAPERVCAGDDLQRMRGGFGHRQRRRRKQSAGSEEVRVESES